MKKYLAPHSLHLQKIKEKYENRLLLLPNVAGVGIGYKITKGIQTDTPCIKVYVSRKIISRKLSKDKVVPTQFDGILTDVEEIGAIKASA